MKRAVPTVIRLARFLGLAAAAVTAGACGDLDNFTTVHDLRVLAVKSEPAGFLVPLDHPETIGMTEATLTALVVDPQSGGAVLSFAGDSCPDTIDTVTAASGKMSSLCPGPGVTNLFPEPYKSALATQPFAPGTTGPLPPSTIQYEPQVKVGLTPQQIGLFFLPPDVPVPPTGLPTQDQALRAAIDYNRDFSLAAIVDLNFALGGQAAGAIKRVVYWPQLDPLPGTACAGPQVPNQNPAVTKLDLFARRLAGDPVDPYPDPAVVSRADLSAKGAQHRSVFVQPSYDPASAEDYLLRVTNFNAGGVVETQCRHELLTFQFFATVGTFGPAERTSELPPFLTSGDGKVHLDSEWSPPKEKDEPPRPYTVNVWVVVRDERAGAGWLGTSFTVTD